MSLLAHAVNAIQAGFAIFPLDPGGKTPHRLYPDRSPEDAPWTMKWGDIATRDINQVVAWWTWSPMANIAVAAKPSNLLIVDCDMHMRPDGLADTPYANLHDLYGPVVGGDDVFRELCQRYGGQPEDITGTFTVTTGSGGAHYYYTWPQGVQASQASPVREYVDVRCNGGSKGGYVLAAGSVTEKGSYTPDNTLPVLDAPPWLVELVREKPRPVMQQPLLQQPRLSGGGNHQGLINQVLYAQPGNVNFSCFWAARCMYSDGVPEQQAIELLAPAYATANGRGGHRHGVDTVRSGYKLQAQKEGPR